ncbi:hypothetical protein KSS87_007136 [Heliosperma pusillum]|nr:hypothetical protein KSS87_007136 [Heliosperma pusillum]
MTTISNFPVRHSPVPLFSPENKPAFRSIWIGNNAPFKSKPPKNVNALLTPLFLNVVLVEVVITVPKFRYWDGAYAPSWIASDLASGSLFCSCSSVRHSTRIDNGLNIQMALVDERLSSNVDLGKRFGTLAYDLVQGALVRWSSLMDKSVPEPPTAVLVHGILGCRKNWGSFARRLAKSFPMWQFLLIDLRCHGDSASMKKRSPHTVAAAALDVLKLVSQLRITPRVLVGHSFGGKVVMSMVEQAAKPLARPVKVWVLDATPGKVRPGGHGEDHPAELISYLRRMPEKIPSKQYVLDALVQEGFSKDVAQKYSSLAVCALILQSGSRCNFRNGSNHLKGKLAFILAPHSTVESEPEALGKIVEDVPRGVHVNFLKAERSLHRWALEDIQRIHAAEEVAADEGAGVQMHVLEDAGHWVHTDNPDGLFKILCSSFEQFRA